MMQILHVPAIGGTHQFAHFLPIAFEVARRGRVEVKIFVPSIEDKREVSALAEELSMPLPQTIQLDLPSGLQRFVPDKVDKLTRILVWLRQLRNCDAILCAERTTTILKRLPGRCPLLLHIPHGAGDRAVGFEGRFRLFDKVFVAGPKDRDRLITEGLVRDADCMIAGPVKVASVLRAHKTRPPLFSNDRPLVLYNPHFSPKLSSADTFVHRLADAVVRDGRYNLIIAPHVRLAGSWAAQRRSEWESLAIDGQIMVDLGSRRSIDMTYTLGADLYVGDVSSQVYEFLVRPRPCLFVNSHDAAWEGSEDYAMWRFGEVVLPDCDIPAAIHRAFCRHPEFRDAQVERTSMALHGLNWSASGEPCFPMLDPIIQGANLVEAAMAGSVSASPPQTPAV